MNLPKEILMEDLTVVKKLTKDLKLAAKKLSDDEARFLVDTYYQLQEDRKRGENQVRSMQETGEPNEVLTWFAEQSAPMEQQILTALIKYTDEHPIAAWLKEIHGVGAVLAAGLIAHIDITKSPTVGHIWRFAGLDPTSKWGKGQKRPWNAQLKVLCWKIGQSIMKSSNSLQSVYGPIYRKRKQYELDRNNRGDNKDLALELAPKFGKTTEAYGHLMGGKLPPAQIDARARRYAVKLLLSDLHAHWYQMEYGVPPPKPYPIAVLGHAHHVVNKPFRPHEERENLKKKAKKSEGTK